MSPTTVGLLGHTGLVGKKLLPELAALHAEGKIALTVLHRSSSDSSAIPEGVAARVLDLTAADGPEYDKSVEGLQVIISAVGSEGLLSQTNLIPALKRSSSFVTFIPSDFGIDWTAEELEPTQISFLKDKKAVEDKFHETGVTITEVYAGMFLDMFLTFPEVKGNTYTAYGKSDSTKRPYVSVAYLAKALAPLVSAHSPKEIAGHKYGVVEYEADDVEWAKVLEIAHGSAPTAKPVTDEIVAGMKAGPNIMGQLFALVLIRAGKTGYHWTGVERVQVPGWEPVPLAELVKKAVA